MKQGRHNRVYPNRFSAMRRDRRTMQPATAGSVESHATTEKDDWMKQRYRVVKTQSARRVCWAVQRLVGYTDGRPSYQLVKKFWRKSEAVGYAVLSEMGLADGTTVESQPTTEGQW